MKFLSNEKLFKCVCLFMMTLTGISILVGTQLMKIILSVALGLFVVYALLNLIISIQEKKQKVRRSKTQFMLPLADRVPVRGGHGVFRADGKLGRA